jgi:hypothetical protein
MKHGGVLRGILRDIGRTFGVVNFKILKIVTRSVNEILTE